MKKKPVAADNYTGLVRPLTSLAALAGLVAAFVGLFPSQQRLSALTRERESDALSIAYMQLLLRTRPYDEALRAALARNLAGAGKWDEARATLAPLLGEASETGQHMRLQALELELSILQQLPKDSAQRGVVTGTIAERIKGLRKEPLTAQALARLAEISLVVTLPGEAAQIYHQLALREPGRRPSWLVLAATQYLANNEPERAAQLYEKAALQAGSDGPDHRQYTLLALDAYLAANKGAEALRLAEAAVPVLGRDPEFMQRVVALALAQNNLPAAQRLGRQLVALKPGDAGVLLRQFELEVAAKDLPAALALASSLLALEPAQPAHRVRLARMAEWAGKTQLALEQWALLARSAPASEAMDNALRLAQGRQNDGVWLELATLAAQKRPLKAQESAALAAIQARDATSRALIAFLNDYRKRYPLQPAQGEALANALGRQGDLPAALAVWQDMSSRQISAVEAAWRQAELLIRLQKPEEAWAVLQPVRSQARPGDTAYWQSVGDLAWTREPRSGALVPYRTVLEAGSFNPLAMERLIELYNAGAEPEKAIAVGQQGYRQLGEARWLLLAMDTASRASNWEALRSLSRQARKDEQKFASSEMYWQLEAQLASHDGGKARARTAYQRALALNPTSVATRVQLLWSEMDAGNPSQLEGYLQQWRADAQAEPAYWSAYAMALLQLKKPQESLVWFERQARAQPQDVMWGLSHAQALEAADHKDAARRLRASLLPRLKEKLGPADALTRPRDKGLMLAYAAIVRDVDGAVASDQVLQQMLRRGHDDAEVYQLLVASSLSQEKFDQAHDWLVRAEAAHHRLPAYQSLAVALEQDDRPALEKILLQRDKELSPADQVTALRQLGRHVLALSLTEKSLLDADEASSERLRQHRDQLRVQLARRIEAGYERRNLSDLHIGRAQVAASFPLESSRATVRLAHNSLRADGSALKAVDGLSENDASVQLDLSLGKDPLRLTLGRNQRSDESLTYGRLEWTHALGKRLTARLDLSLHGLTEETSALRAFGSKDKVAIGLSGNPSEATYARVELAGQRFNTRSGDKLGEGYRIEGEFGGTPFKSAPAWQMRVSGSSEKNRLADRLPPALAAALQLPPAAVANVLSPRFSTLGVGATYRYGAPEGTPRRTQGLVDGWVGRQWPANELAYSLRAGVSVPVTEAGQVRLEGFYTNVQGGVSTQANRGVSLWYRHEF